MPLSSVPASVIRVLGAPGRWSVAAQTFALQVLIAVLVVGAGLVGAYGQAQRAGDQQAMARALAVAETMAATPSATRTRTRARSARSSSGTPRGRSPVASSRRTTRARSDLRPASSCPFP